MSATDGQASNIDLSVLEAASGRVVAVDDHPDARPLVMFSPVAGQSYAARIANVASSGPSLVTTLILDAH